jgi:prevent-host-death family protein
MTWKLADAKNRFSELVTRAHTEGLQLIQRRRDAVVVMAASDFERLSGRRPGFKQYLLSSPSFEGADVSRDRSPARDIAL